MTAPDIDTSLKSIAANSAKPEATLAFHPLADEFPEMKMGELRELADDINDHGLIEPITLYEGKILDGRNRYRACQLCGRQPHFHELPADINPVAYVISKNIQRRHLTAEQKRDLLATLIKIDPSKSNRAIAAEAKVDDKTVGAVRRELEATAEIPQLETTIGKDGKKRKTKGKGGSPKGGKGKDKGKAITYAQVIDARTAINAYSVLEEHLLDALQDLNQNSSFAHAQEYGERTVEKLQEKLNELQVVEDEAREEEKRHVA
jgi:ParB-like nuclease domain